jgi:hypothetical protein
MDSGSTRLTKPSEAMNVYRPFSSVLDASSMLAEITSG